MNSVHLLERFFGVKRFCWALLTVALIVYWCPNQSGAASKPITPEELQYSGPFELTARIMEIDLGKNMLIVAEKEIYVVDVMVGAEHLLTVFSDAEGGAAAFESFARGQTVLVRGIELPDGRVIAELIQLASDRSPGGQTDNGRTAIRPIHEIKRIN
jgi:hypothetical protein